MSGSYAGLVQPPVALTIAGSDSGGGAGIQADLATFAAFGIFGTSAVTAVTAQNTTGLFATELISVEVIGRQIDTVISDLPVRATKTGMLGQPAAVMAVGRRAAGGQLPHLVVDPVMVTTNGDDLTTDTEAMLVAFRRHLLPHAEVVTPNLAEARSLTGLSIEPDDESGTVDAMIAAGSAIAEFGPKLVVVTGGHVPGGSTPDVVIGPGRSVHVLDGPRQPTTNDHGTGCTFSAAIAAGLAQGLAPLAAVQRAKVYVADALTSAASWQLGRGRGPVNHQVWAERDLPSRG